MGRTVNQISMLQDYLRGVITKAEHHAQDVDEIALAVLGAVLWRNDGGELDVREYKGEMANVLQFEVNGTRYALAYNHSAAAIEVRKGGTRGTPLEQFSNATPVADVKRFFAAL